MNTSTFLPPTLPPNKRCVEAFKYPKSSKEKKRTVIKMSEVLVEARKVPAYVTYFTNRFVRPRREKPNSLKLIKYWSHKAQSRTPFIKKRITQKSRNSWPFLRPKLQTAKRNNTNGIKHGTDFGHPNEVCAC